MSETASPLVRICVPAYNSGATLHETLDSLLLQTYQNLSILVVDNASTDRTVEIAESYAAKDSRVRVVRNSENVGGEGNFTRCLQLAAGKYTALFHSDDVYTPEIVARMTAFLDSHPQAGAVFSMAQLIDGQGNAGRIYRVPPELKGREEYGFDEIFRAVLKYGNFFFCPGVMARTEVYRDYIRIWDAGGFKTSADLDVWLRILLRFKIGIIDEPLLLYRGASDTSFSYTAARKRTAPADMLGVVSAYVNGPAAAIMGAKELVDYDFLVLKDSINRAFNHFSVGEGRQGRALLRGLLRPATIMRSLGDSCRLKTTVYGLIVYLLSWLPLGEKSRGMVVNARFRI